MALTVGSITQVLTRPHDDLPVPQVTCACGLDVALLSKTRHEGQARAQWRLSTQPSYRARHVWTPVGLRKGGRHRFGCKGFAHTDKESFAERVLVHSASKDTRRRSSRSWWLARSCSYDLSAGVCSEPCPMHHNRGLKPQLWAPKPCPEGETQRKTPAFITVLFMRHRATVPLFSGRSGWGGQALESGLLTGRQHRGSV